VNNLKESIRSELRELIISGYDMYVAQIIMSDSNKDDDDRKAAREKSAVYVYQKWYSKSKRIVRHILPDRSEEFEGYYIQKNRKQIGASNYSISDYLVGLKILYGTGKEMFDHEISFLQRLLCQVQILESCLDCFDSLMYNIRGILQADVFDSELEAAKELLRNGHIRAAGALAGVTLESHLAVMANDHNCKIGKKNPTIADYNDVLKNEKVYDTPNWRFIQRLSDIRNMSVHKKQREPTKEEVEELTQGTDKVIKTFF